ncbi:unnamed protein product [Peniophora sp. CBMAI 1063]|nr:unnamed protein product [Peniophora sp. CBMAI 1063]
MSTAAHRAMPVPHAREAPYFDGKRIRDFIAHLEECGRAAGLSESELPKFVARYCSTAVRELVQCFEQFAGTDWDAAKKQLLIMYGANDEPPRYTLSDLRAFCKTSAHAKPFRNRTDVEAYYRDFHKIAKRLLNQKVIDGAELNRYFYRGLPERVRDDIRLLIPATNRKADNPPTVETVMGLVKAKFDESNLDAWDADLDSGTESEADGYETANEDDYRTSNRPGPSRSGSPPPPAASQPNKGKGKVMFKPTTTQIPAAPPVDPSQPRESSVDTLTDQLRALSINSLNLDTVLRALNKDQIYELVTKGTLSAASSPSGSSAPLPPPRGSSPAQNRPGFREACFVCGQPEAQHSIQRCPETLALIQEGLVQIGLDSITQRRRVLLIDGSELPIAPPTPPGEVRKLAPYIRHLAAAGKIPRASSAGTSTSTPGSQARDTPPHQPARTAPSASSGAVSFIIDPPTVEASAHAAESLPPHPDFYLTADYSVAPVTRSGRDTAARSNTAPYPEDKRRPAPASKPPSSTQAPTPTTQQPRAPNPVPPATNQQRPNRAPPPSAPVPVVPPPHPLNTRAPPRKQPAGTDIDMREAEKPRDRYHFTSNIQEAVKLEDVEKRIWDLDITLPLRDLVGISPLLQKSVTEYTRVRREYITQNAQGEFEAHVVDADHVCPQCHTASLLVSPGDTVHAPDTPEDRALFGTSVARAFSAESSSGAFYSMATGHLAATINGSAVTLMLDTGSELNLISERLVAALGLPLDSSGSHWHVKGVNGGPVRLRGVVHNVPILIGGLLFPHHFFVTRSGSQQQGQPSDDLSIAYTEEATTSTHDLLCGQPFIQHFNSRLDFTRSGLMTLQLWTVADRSNRAPSISVVLSKPNNPRNHATLIHAAIALPGDQLPENSASVEEVGDAAAASSAF